MPLRGINKGGDNDAVHFQSSMLILLNNLINNVNLLVLNKAVESNYTL